MHKRANVLQDIPGGMWDLLLLNNSFPSHFPQWPYQSALVCRAHLPHSQLMAFLPVLPRKESMSPSNSHSHKLTSSSKKYWVPVFRVRGCIPYLIQSFPFTPDPIPCSLWRLFQAWPKSLPKTKTAKIQPPTPFHCHILWKRSTAAFSTSSNPVLPQPSILWFVPTTPFLLHIVPLSWHDLTSL